MSLMNNIVILRIIYRINIIIMMYIGIIYYNLHIMIQIQIDRFIILKSFQ